MSEAENSSLGFFVPRVVTSFLHNTVVVHFVVKVVQGKTNSCHRLPGLCFLLCLQVPWLSLVNSVSLYVTFSRVSRRVSSCLSKLSQVLFASIGTSLHEPEHSMDEPMTVNSRSGVGKWLRKGFRSCCWNDPGLLE